MPKVEIKKYEVGRVQSAARTRIEMAAYILPINILFLLHFKAIYAGKRGALKK